MRAGLSARRRGAVLSFVRRVVGAAAAEAVAAAVAAVVVAVVAAAITVCAAARPGHAAAAPSSVPSPAPRSAPARAGHWSRAFQPAGLDGQSGMEGQVFFLGEHDGKLAVGGWFERAADLPAKNIAFWDGEEWSALEGGPDGLVRALYSDYPYLYVGGEFTTVNGEAQRGFACHEGVPGGNGWLTSWGSPGGFATAFVPFNGHLYAVGTFLTPASEGAALAYRDGEGWHHDLLDWPGYATIYDVQVWDFWLHIGSDVGLLRWDGDDSFVYVVTGSVTALQPRESGLYAGGTFANAGGGTTYGLATVGDTAFVPLLDSELEANYVVGLSEAWGKPLAVALDHEVRYWQGYWGSPLGGAFQDDYWPMAVFWWGGDLYAGGIFPNGIARWDDAADEWVGLGGGLGVSNHSHLYIDALARWDGDVYAGGTFALAALHDSDFGGHLARWDGSAWHRVGNGLDKRVWALQPFQGSLVVAGDFEQADWQPLVRIGRWDGSQWHDMGGANGRVKALGVHDGELIVGGWFTTIGGIAARFVAAWDGAIWRAFAGTPQGSVNAIASFRGDIVVAGDITTIGGVTCNRIARYDGSAWHALGEGLDGTVQALAVWQGDLYAAGLFQNAGGAPAAGIARWDGSAWHPLGDGLGGLDALYGVSALQPTRDLLFVGGCFTTAGGQPASCLAAWDGAAWSEWGGGVGDGGVTTRVQALAVKDGDLYVGGQFMQAGGVTSCNFARWVDGTIVPTLLSRFAARQAAGGEGGAGAGAARAVELSWSTSEPVSAAALSLTARAGQRSWDVAFRVDGGGEGGGAVLGGAQGEAFTARDESPHLASASTVTYTLRHAGISGGDGTAGDWTVLAERSVTLDAPPPARLCLAAHPNPFNPRTDVSFELERSGTARLAVYELTGRKVAELENGRLPAGRHVRVWDGRDGAGRDLPSGAYVVHLVTESQSRSVKVMLLR